MPVNIQAELLELRLEPGEGSLARVPRILLLQVLIVPTHNASLERSMKLREGKEKKTETRLLREKDLLQLKKVENVFIRFSVDGWGKADEWIRQDTKWEEKLQVMDQYYKHFKLRVWDYWA